jgi:hypothetical protein
MPTISKFFGILIQMYYDDHNPPHFHAIYGDEHILISIEDLSVIAGKLTPRALGLVIEWASNHKDELMKDWELARQKQPLFSINPLN